MRSSFPLKERMEEMDREHGKTWLTKPRAYVEGKLHKNLKKKNNGIMGLKNLNILIESNLLYT